MDINQAPLFSCHCGRASVCKLPSSPTIFARGTNIAGLRAILKLICSPTLLLRFPVPAYSC